MSAFVVGDEHIHLLCTAAVENQLSWYHDGEYRYIKMLGATAVGEILLAANHRSVNYRYDESHEPRPYCWERIWQYAGGGDAMRVQALKACACLEYQCCEYPEWEESEAHTIIEALRIAVIRSLDGYEDAPWEWVRPSE